MAGQLMRFFIALLLASLNCQTACSGDPASGNSAVSPAEEAAQLDPNERFGDFSRAERWYVHMRLPKVNDGIVKQFEVIEPLLEAGDLVAIKKFARAYSGGRGPLGGPQNFEKSFALYKQAAERGDPAAMISVGYMYMRGTGTQQDHRAALLSFEEAYNATGDMGAARGIAAIYNGYDNSDMEDPREAAKWKDRSRGGQTAKDRENRIANRQQARAEQKALEAALTAGVDDGAAVLRRFYESEIAVIKRDARRNVPEAVHRLANIKLAKDAYWQQTGYRDPVDPAGGVQLLERYYEMETKLEMRRLVAERLAELYGDRGLDELRDPEREALWLSRTH